MRECTLPTWKPKYVVTGTYMQEYSCGKPFTMWRSPVLLLLPELRSPSKPVLFLQLPSISIRPLADRLRELSYLNAGITLTLTDKRTPGRWVLSRPKHSIRMRVWRSLFATWTAPKKSYWQWHRISLPKTGYSCGSGDDLTTPHEISYTLLYVSNINNSLKGTPPGISAEVLPANACAACGGR